MNLNFDVSLVKRYTNQSQKIRILTESWVEANSFCPCCGNNQLTNFENNRPVADFYCQVCKNEFELKSKNGNLGNKIIDGAYDSMVKRIQSKNNPNFFFLTYNKISFNIENFLIIPKHYFITDFIQKRRPLAIDARRAGWIGCNILLDKIPSHGRIYLIKNSIATDKNIVINKWKETEFLKDLNQKSKGWIVDILRCIDAIPTKIFSLQELYCFENILKIKHPENNFIKDKIRQQLQVLKDKGTIKFIGKGIYEKRQQNDIYR